MELFAPRQWDINDHLVGRAEHTGLLSPGESYGGTLTAELPAVNPGQYYVNSTLRTGQERFYKVNAPADETLLFTLDGQDPRTSNELYARFNQMVSRNAFDFLQTLAAERRDGARARQ